MTQLVGFGFSRDDASGVDVFCSTDPASGVLCWSSKHLASLARVNFKVPSLKEKQLHMITYLFELVAELMLAPADNVSQSPEFEAPFGIFGGEDS